MRLIDAENILKEYEHIDWYCVSKEGQFMRGATTEDNPLIHYYDGEEIIKNAPTVDAVEVVRCKDCEHLVNATVNGNGFLICDISDMETAPDDFCSHGDRREEAAP